MKLRHPIRRLSVMMTMALLLTLPAVVAAPSPAAAAPTCPCSIWGDAAVPSLASSPDTRPVELGLKFRADQAGTITGLRFYKGSANTGTHPGHLWTSSGTLLGSATFASETATGWQQVSFSPAVPIQANVTYVASYFAPNGGYAKDENYFATSGFTNPPLTALASGIEGPNGVFTYDYAPGFPNETFLSTNYWIDVVFLPSTGVPAPPPAVPPCPCSFWGDGVLPAVTSSADDHPVEVGLKFRTDRPGVITGLRFYKGPNNNGLHDAHLWTSTGTLLSTIVFTGESAGGWQQMSLLSPVAVQANTTYVASYFATHGRYSKDENYFAGTGFTNGPLTAMASGIDGSNGVYSYDYIPGFPTDSFVSTNYWVDVVFVPNAMPTTLMINGATTGDYNDPATVSATLAGSNAAGVPGRPVTFTLNGVETCTAATDSSGKAACSITPHEAAGVYTLKASFTGGAGFEPSTASKAFQVTLEQAVLTYTGPTTVANGVAANLSGVLKEDGVTPIAGRTVSFTLGSGPAAQSCAGTTSAAGVASCTVATVAQPASLTSVPIAAAFAGDPYYRPASANVTALVQYMTGRAFGLSANTITVDVSPTPDTGSITTAGATSTSTPCVAAIRLVVIRADSLCAEVTTTLNPGASTATATVDHVTVALPGVPVVEIDGARATSRTTCSGSFGQTTIAFLKVGNTVVIASLVQPAPNTAITVSGVALILNEQVAVPGGLIVNAVRMTLPGNQDVTVASATSAIHNCP